MIYTAVTRAKRVAVLIGDRTRIAQAVAAPSPAWGRRQALDVDRAVEAAGLAS